MRATFATVAIAALVLSGNSFAGGIGCPAGTTPNGENTPDVSEAWCEIIKDGKTEMHGPYRSWWPNGKVGNKGQYDHGQMIGQWRAWHENGKLQAEEWYKNGRKIKGLYWDKNGIKTQEPKT
jgi:antitoxin component YwqK of YwqJK toxin-antitoxin module